MARRRAATPLIGVGVVYAGFLAAFLSIPWNDPLSLGLVFLAWALLALAVLGLILTSLVFVFNELRVWLRIATIALTVPVVLVAPYAVLFGIWSLQDHSASYAAYDTAEQLCGGPPVIGDTSWGGGYVLPNTHDYSQRRYTSRDRFLVLGPATVYYCTEAEAKAHGLKPEFP